MRLKGSIVSLLLALCLLQNFAFSQNISNEGTDFWAVFPSHDPSKNNAGIPTSLANVRVYISAKAQSEVSVSCGSFNSGLIQIPPNTAVPVDIPRPSAYIEEAESNAILDDKAIHVFVSSGKPKVTVFQHIYAGARSAASLILPVNALGREYFSMNYDQDLDPQEISKNFLVLVATEDNTSLIVEKTDGTRFTVNFTTAGQVYQYMPPDQEDLTGMYVTVDPTSPDNCNKRFAAYSGSTSMYIGCSGSRDPLFQQLYPTDSWGKKYGVAPFIDRRYNLRVLARENNTRVTMDGQNLTLNRGEHFTFTNLSSASSVSADKKISVAQYSLTQNCSSIFGGELRGDPEMVLLNPIEFNVRSTTLFSSDKERIVDRYINVVIKTAAIGTFRINGNIVPANWQSIRSDPQYSFAHFQITEESSYLTADDGFNAIAYGFGSHESYAYSAGTNLATNNYLVIKNNITSIEAPNACINQPSDLKIVLPTTAVKIVWMLDNNPPVIGSTTPRVFIDEDGETRYEYTFGNNIIFPTIERHKMVVNAELSSSAGCLSSSEEYTYFFEVDPIPDIRFSADKPLACEGQSIQFKDESNSLAPGKIINKWLWDFGDGTTSEDQNPVHQYTHANRYKVRLFAGIDDGCMSEIEQVITISPMPKIEFKEITSMCISDSPITLRQAQELTGLNGSGAYNGPGIVDPAGVFDPAAAGPGTHTLSYTFKNSSGCQDIKTQTVIISSIPVIKIPKDVFILEGGELKLNVTDDGQKSRYFWSPADAYIENPNIINPRIFSGQEDRSYTLTVVTAGGCTAIQTIDVHVVKNLEPSNAFSPNDDGVNDYWVIKYIETYPNTTVQIFNRLGEKVFFSNNYAQPFDGRYNGKALPVGTYYYIIDPKNGRPRLTGSLTLIR